MKKRHIILLVLLVIMLLLLTYRINAQYNFTEYINEDIPVNSSLDDLCEIALEKSKQFKQLNIYELKVVQIRFTDYKNLFDPAVDIVLVDVSSDKNSVDREPYKLLFEYNLNENKLEYVTGFSNESMVYADINLDYQNWNIDSDGAINIYKNYLEQINEDDERINCIDGTYSDFFGTPIWRIEGVRSISIDPYTGNILKILE